MWANEALGISPYVLGGGGVYLTNIGGQVTKNTIIGNSGRYGGGVAIFDDTACTLDRNIIAFSKSPTPLVQACELYCNETFTFAGSENVFWPVGGGSASCNDCSGLALGSGNVVADPRLCDWQSGDTSIAADSPAARDGVAYAGAGEVRAGCLTAVERVTWGRLKARY